MIKGHAYPLTLTYGEVAALDEYLDNNGTSLERVAHHASWSASPHGVTVTFGTEDDRDAVWELVLDATGGDEED